jgi:hypothetical protein
VRRRRAGRTTVGMLAAFVLFAPGAVHAQGPACLTAGPLPAARPPTALRFGITGQAAGSAGVGQGTVAPEDSGKAFAALDRLKLPRRDLVLRLNRMFQADGDAGIARFAKLTDAYAARGFKVELQVRYHPTGAQNGDIPAYVAYVRKAVQTFAPKPAVVALSITNEPNLVASPNTSDGYFRGNVDALVQGLKAARKEADRLGRPDLQLGFTYAYRFVADERFFDEIGKRSDPELQHALDYVGLQAYPGLFYPPVGLSPAPQAMVDAANLLRTCFFPRAHIGARTKIWVTENGYRSRRGDDPAVQARNLTQTVDALRAQSGTLGISDYRYFNLRDNNSVGADLFDAVGLLYDDYAPKLAFGAYRDAIARDGQDVVPVAPKRRCPPRQIVVHPVLRRGEHLVARSVRGSGGRVAAGRLGTRSRTVVLRVSGRRPGHATRIRITVRTSIGRRLVLVRRLAACPG